MQNNLKKKLILQVKKVLNLLKPALHVFYSYISAINVCIHNVCFINKMIFI